MVGTHNRTHRLEAKGETMRLAHELSQRPGRSAAVPFLLAALLLATTALEAQRRQAPTGPRITPSETSESELNVIKTMARHAKLSEAWMPFAGYILGENSIPERDRELVILRTAWLCGADYEWGHHKRLGLSVGLTEEEIERIPKGPSAAGWTSFERGLLRAADQLHNSQAITERTWGTLKARYSDEQMMDLVFTVGQYTLVSMALKSFRVQREEGVEGLPPSEP